MIINAKKVEMLAKALTSMSLGITSQFNQKLKESGINTEDLEKLAIALEAESNTKAKQNKAWYEQRRATQRRQFTRY